jgi:hypothetical protein
MDEHDWHSASFEPAVKIGDPDLIEAVRTLLKMIQDFGLGHGRAIPEKTLINELQEIHNSMSGSSKKLAGRESASDTPLLWSKRLRQIIYPSRGCKSLLVSDVLTILEYANRYIAKSEDDGIKHLLRKHSEPIRIKIEYRRRNLDDDFDALESFLPLGIKPGAQEGFSKVHAGWYFLIRFEADDRLVVSSMHVAECTRDDPICRFHTRRRVGQEDVREVDGYIYSFGPLIYSLGRITKTPVVRCAILRDTPGEGNDMVGLRLGLLPNLVPHAQRLYCKFLGREELIDIEPLTTSWKYDEDTIAKFKSSVPDLKQIAEDLKDEPHSSYDLRLPGQYS